MRGPQEKVNGAGAWYESAWGAPLARFISLATLFCRRPCCCRRPSTRFSVVRAGGTLDCSQASYPALCLLQIRPLLNGGFTVTAGALRRTDRRFVPCLSDAEAQVADMLAARQRCFARPLRFDAFWERALADYALVEDSRAPIAVFVLSTCGSPMLDEAKRGAAAVFARVPGIAHVWKNGGWCKPAP